MLRDNTSGLRAWFRSGEPWIWMNAAAVGISIAAVTGLLLLIAMRGFAHFWPAGLAGDPLPRRLRRAPHHPRRDRRQREPAGVPVSRVDRASPDSLPEDQLTVERWLIKTGNRRSRRPGLPLDRCARLVEDVGYPEDAVVLERMEWGNAYGFLRSVYQDGVLSSEGRRPGTI
jgi:phosphate transport system permease protein